jgi:hypothetical protein
MEVVGGSIPLAPTNLSFPPPSSHFQSTPVLLANSNKNR